MKMMLNNYLWFLYPLLNAYYITDSEGVGSDSGDEGTDDAGGDGDGTGDGTGDGDGEGSNEGNEGVPESYADYVLPDGMEIDSALLEKVNPLFMESGLSQEQAQSLVSTYAEHIQAHDKAQQDAFDAEVVAWEKSVKDDKELGGDNFKETQRLSALGLQHFGTPELGEFFNKYGIGSHPEIVKMMVKVGKLVQEDGHGDGDSSSNTGEKSLAEKLYPDAKG